MRIKRILQWKFSGGIRLCIISVSNCLSLSFPSLSYGWFGICWWFIAMILSVKARKAPSLQDKTEKFKQITSLALLRLSCSSHCSSSLAVCSQSCLCSITNFSLWTLQLWAAVSFNHKLLYGFLWACSCSCFSFLTLPSPKGEWTTTILSCNGLSWLIIFFLILFPSPFQPIFSPGFCNVCSWLLSLRTLSLKKVNRTDYFFWLKIFPIKIELVNSEKN